MLPTILLRKCVVPAVSSGLKHRVRLSGSSCVIEHRLNTLDHFSSAGGQRAPRRHIATSAMSHTAKAIKARTADPSKFESLDHLQTAQVDVPEPGEGEVLVAIKLRPVNPTDIAQSKGLYGDGRDGKPFSVG